VTTLLEQQQSRPTPLEIDTVREGWAEPVIEETAVEPPLPRPRVRSRTLFNDIRDTILMVVAIYTLVNLIAPRYIVEGDSMQPNFETGEWIIVNRLGYLTGAPQRGDVVILDFEEPQEDLIKRVVGLPGETIEIHDGLVFVDGVPLNEPYTFAEPRYLEEPVTLGPDEYFVLGDNRNNSRDSHMFGPVTRDHVIGKAWLIYWPPPDWGTVPHFDYSSVPPATLPATPTPYPTEPPTEVYPVG
jgi:signal peptidase I